jgi:hypothetical protein
MLLMLLPYGMSMTQFAINCPRFDFEAIDIVVP